MRAFGGTLRRMWFFVPVALLAACLLVTWLACGDVFATESSEAARDAEQGTSSSAGEEGSGQGPSQLIDTYMAGREQDQGLAVAVSESGATVAERYYGSSDASGNSPVDGQTTFEWGGCADLLVWVSLMQLSEEGLLSLSATVDSLLPEGTGPADGYGAIDILDLMDHTSGLDVALNGSRSSIPDGTTSVEAAFPLFSVEVQSDPGDMVAYTPFDALLGAAVVEAVSGEDFVSYVNEHIFERIGMESTYLMIGGSPARMARQGDGSLPVVSLAEGASAPAGTSVSSSLTSSIFSCCGTVSDLLLFANAVMGVEGVSPVFDDEKTAASMFEVTRTYPGLGVARSAHGMTAFPLAEGVFGFSASTSTGFSASVYMRPDDGLAVAIMVNQAGRADLTQGIPRVLVGRSELSVSDASSLSNGMWVGTYQDASDPNHGPTKLLTTLRRVGVAVNEQGVLMFDGLTATSLGAGVYSVDTASDQDVYRFHVSLERGSEFSRSLSDSYIVPWSTLAVEGGLLVAFGLSWLLCLSYTAAGAFAWVRGRFVRRRRARVQPAALLLSSVTLAAGTAGIFAALQIAEGLAPATIDVLLAGEGVYVAVALLVGGWIAFTRWRSPQAWTFRQRIACFAVGFAAVATVVNLMYWEMLP